MGEEVLNGHSCISIVVPEGVGAGTRGCACVRVAEAGSDSNGFYVVGKQDGCVGVAELMKGNLGETVIFGEVMGPF